MKFLDAVFWILVVYVIYFAIVIVYDLFFKRNFKKHENAIEEITVLRPHEDTPHMVDYQSYLPSTENQTVFNFSNEVKQGEVQLESDSHSGGSFFQKKK
jgi:hypothetical protein